MKPILSLEHLVFAYQDTLILEDVSFNVYPGEFIGIIGPNGGGKTTLLKLILGFLKPISGSVKVFDHPSHLGCKNVAYVPQVMHFDRHFPISVLELVLQGRLSRLPWYGFYHQTDKQAAFNALEKVGLLDFCHRPFGTLSGGQAQRALIARALVSEPKLLLLDEPTASVDAQAEKEIYRLIQDLRGSLTMMMVTHDLKTAIDQVQRVFCVKSRVVALKPEEVCEHYAMGLYHAPLQLQSLK